MEISAFLSEKLSAQYGDEAARIFAGFSSQRLTTLRVNRLKTDADSVRRALADAGIETQTAAWSEDALILLNAKEDAVSALPIFENGELVYDKPSLQDIRSYCKQQIDTLWDEVLRFENPHNYYVDLSRKLWDIKHELLDNGGVLRARDGRERL